MNNSALIIATVIVAVASQPSTRAGQSAAPAPPGSAGIYKAGSDLAAILEKATQSTPDMSTSAVANTDQ